MLYFRKFKAVAVKSLAELTVLHEYLYVLIVTRHYTVSRVEDSRIIAEYDSSVNVVENGGSLAVNERIILHSVSEYLPRPEPVHVSAEVLADELHTLAAHSLAKFLDFVCKFISVVEYLSGGRYFGFFGMYISTALRVGLELGYSLYLVAPQLDTQGLIRLHGEDVDDIAADGELRSSLDLFTALIAAPRESETELVAVNGIADRELYPRRNQRLRQGLPAA